MSQRADSRKIEKLRKDFLCFNLHLSLSFLALLPPSLFKCVGVVPACLSVCVFSASGEQKRQKIPAAGVTESSELPCGFWGPLEEQLMSLIAELLFQPP